MTLHRISLPSSGLTYICLTDNGIFNVCNRDTQQFISIWEWQYFKKHEDMFNLSVWNSIYQTESLAFLTPEHQMSKATVWDAFIR